MNQMMTVSEQMCTVTVYLNTNARANRPLVALLPSFEFKRTLAATLLTPLELITTFKFVPHLRLSLKQWTILIYQENSWQI